MHTPSESSRAMPTTAVAVAGDRDVLGLLERASQRLRERPLSKLSAARSAFAARPVDVRQ